MCSDAELPKRKSSPSAFLQAAFLLSFCSRKVSLQYFLCEGIIINTVQQEIHTDDMLIKPSYLSF